jgi:hypothetical protein
MGVVYTRNSNNQQSTQNSSIGSQISPTSISDSLITPSESGPDTSSWQTSTDAAQHVSFKYPQLSTKYITATGWPPKVQVTKGQFTCTQAGSENAQAGKTEQVTINGHTYCVTKETEGAAGSIYTQYAYAFPKDTSVVIFTFSLRMVQCANYESTEMRACEQERQSFNIDPIIDQISQTTKFTQ